MAMWKVIVLLLIVSLTFVTVDGRSRRKRRQYSSASYYLGGLNPYANPNIDPAALTYPSGSFYNAPSYPNPNPDYNSNPTYNTNYYSSGLSQYAQASPYSNLYNSNTEYSNTGSGNNNLYGYGSAGFNNRYPNWNQGNIAQYYTGGAGNGLSNTYTYWYRSFRPGPFQGRPIDTPNGNMMGQNLFAPVNNPPMMGPPGK